MSKLNIEEFVSQAGTLQRTSEWITVDQDTINMFADATHDHQFIHVDLEKAKHTPFKGTIAHGFLSLSLLSKFVEDCMPGIVGAVMGVNYGFDKIRFLMPVPAGSRLRGNFKLVSCEERNPGEYLSKYEVSVEIENMDKPALVAEWLALTFIQK
ncbi:MAG: MaoC family dehydratase [Pseudomonadota bacterium]